MKKLKGLIWPFMLIPALMFTGCSSSAEANDTKYDYLPEAENDSIIASVGLTDEMRVSFIDVGQGDSEFIELPNGQTLLIDAGTNDTGANVTEYISSLGYSSIDYVVGTHPHEDHIGGLDDVINAFDIGALYMPKVIADTKTFEDVLDAAEAKGLSINTAKAGVSLVSEEDLKVEMLAPTLDSYENTNDYSAVIKIVYDDTSFLFMGDSEEFSENLITGSLDSDVLKVGHHGSTTSTGDDFLKKVSPAYAVISCGKGNSYGHPHQETLDKLVSFGAEVYRTDELGTVIAVSDGKNISFDFLPTISDTADTADTSNTTPAADNPVSNGTAKTDVQSPSTEGAVSEPQKTASYVLNTNTKKIHLPGCSSVDKMSESNKAYTDDYQQAINEGYTPCKICNP